LKARTLPKLDLRIIKEKSWNGRRERIERDRKRMDWLGGKGEMNEREIGEVRMGINKRWEKATGRDM